MAGEQGIEGLAVEYRRYGNDGVLNSFERAAVRLSNLVNFTDERMIECGCGQRLTPEPFAGYLIALTFTVQKLDRDTALETGIFGKRHFTHTASAKRGENSVAVRE